MPNGNDIEACIAEIITPQRFWSREKVLASPCPVPEKPGVYGYYFKEIPPGVPTDGCISHKGLILLYIGISPKGPPRDGSRPSRQNLRKRIRYHYRGNAEGSTLRLSLGCLLRDRLGILLRQVGGGNRMTFSDGEEALSSWMGENAFVVWAVYPKPRELESELLGRLSLPLNLQGNETHPFHPELSMKRRECREIARGLPVLPR